MSAEVHISSIFARYVNNQTVIEVEGSTVGECLQDLIRQFPDIKKLILDRDGKLLPSYDVYVNGESMYPQKMTKPVNDGDTLHIVLLIHGG